VRRHRLREIRERERERERERKRERRLFERLRVREEKCIFFFTLVKTTLLGVKG
jgi:hypothetical protein